MSSGFNPSGLGGTYQDRQDGPSSSKRHRVSEPKPYPDQVPYDSYSRLPDSLLPYTGSQNVLSQYHAYQRDGASTLSLPSDSIQPHPGRRDDESAWWGPFGNSDGSASRDSLQPDPTSQSLHRTTDLNPFYPNGLPTVKGHSTSQGFSQQPVQGFLPPEPLYHQPQLFSPRFDANDSNLFTDHQTPSFSPFGPPSGNLSSRQRPQLSPSASDFQHPTEDRSSTHSHDSYHLQNLSSLLLSQREERRRTLKRRRELSPEYSLTAGPSSAALGPLGSTENSAFNLQDWRPPPLYQSQSSLNFQNHEALPPANTFNFPPANSATQGPLSESSLHDDSLAQSSAHHTTAESDCYVLGYPHTAVSASSRAEGIGVEGINETSSPTSRYLPAEEASSSLSANPLDGPSKQWTGETGQSLMPAKYTTPTDETHDPRERLTNYRSRILQIRPRGSKMRQSWIYVQQCLEPSGLVRLPWSRQDISEVLAPLRKGTYDESQITEGGVRRPRWAKCVFSKPGCLMPVDTATIVYSIHKTDVGKNGKDTVNSPAISSTCQSCLFGEVLDGNVLMTCSKMGKFVLASNKTAIFVACIDGCMAQPQATGTGSVFPVLRRTTHPYSEEFPAVEGPN